MDEYEVIMESKDMNVFKCKVKSSSISGVRKLALAKIIEKGWTQYLYKVKAMKKIVDHSHR